MKKLYVFILISLFPQFLMAQSKINDFEELANGYQKQGKFIEAAEFYAKSGYAYWNKEEKSKAIIVFQKAYDIYYSQGNINSSITISNNLGIIYLDIEKYDNALTAFSNVLELARKVKNQVEIFNALVNMGNVSYELGAYNDAVSKANEALPMAKEMNNLKNIGKCYSLMAESYEKLNDSENAYKYFELYASIDKKIKGQEMEAQKQMSQEEISKANETKRITEIELKIKNGELKSTQDSLSISERIALQRKLQVAQKNEELQKKEYQLTYEQKLRNVLLLGMLIVLLFMVVLGLLLRQKLRDNKTLELQKAEINEQRNILDTQNKKIKDSIYYGLRIQQAMLPNLEQFKESIETMIIYRPKDIVSGDFYWFYETETDNGIYQFFALADCTGHGVPGAFMSMIGNRLIYEVVVQQKEYQPSHILELINVKLKTELDQDHQKSVDGMDIALCRLLIKNNQYQELVFSGAKRQVIVVKKDENDLITLDGDRRGIGGFMSDSTKLFSDKTIPVAKGDIIFMYSDGIIDQQNATRDRFGSIRFSKIIQNYRNESMDSIRNAIEYAFDAYTQPEEQRDDISVIGFKLNK